MKESLSIQLSTTRRVWNEVFWIVIAKTNRCNAQQHLRPPSKCFLIFHPNNWKGKQKKKTREYNTPSSAQCYITLTIHLALGLDWGTGLIWCIQVGGDNGQTKGLQCNEKPFQTLATVGGTPPHSRPCTWGVITSPCSTYLKSYPMNIPVASCSTIILPPILCG